MPASTRRYDLLRQPLDRFTRTLRGVDAGDVRAIHRARVASRRLRELVPVLQIEPDQGAKVLRRLRNGGRALGSVRELDVLQLLIEELHDSGRCDPSIRDLLVDELRGERERAWKKLSSGSDLDSFRRVARKLDRISSELRHERRESPRARGWQWALEARLAVRAAILKREIAHAGAVYLPERLHRVRIATKKLRYAVELSAQATQKPQTADLRTLKRGQELLGRLRDLQVLGDFVRRIQASLPAADAAARHLDPFIASIEDSCRRLHARYVRERADLAGVCVRVRARALQKTPRGSPRGAPAVVAAERQIV
jgi:CHAD domain-containing protein